MPNHCDNTLHVSGPCDDVAAFERTAASDDSLLSLATLCPEPDFGALGGRDAWYDWRILHWGTKWDADEVEGGRGGDGDLEYGFQTAWAPPVGAIQSATLRWPTLTFTLSYAEGGADFSGQISWRGGVCLDERGGAYSSIVDEAGHWRGPLHRVCAELPQTAEHLARQALRGRLDHNTVATIRERDDTTALFLRLNDLELCRAYIEHPSTSTDDLWRLGTSVLRRGHGAALLKVLTTSDDSSRSAIGHLLSTLGTILAPPQLVTDTDDDGVANDAMIDALRDWLARATTRQIATEWIEAVTSLFPGWTGDDPADLYQAAWLLLTD